VCLQLGLLLVGAAACGRGELDNSPGGEGGSSEPMDGSAPEGSVLEGSAPEASVPEGSAPCSERTCPTGCCDATGQCQPGDTITQCGNGGEACQSCPVLGFATCDATRHACSNEVPQCDAETCPGCCVGTSCFAGTDPDVCGVGGAACQSCPSGGCNAGHCSACGPANCAGCCDANGTCDPGFLDTQCGGAGSVCVDCTKTSPPLVCDGALAKPICTNATCPAPYAGCAASLTIAPLATQDVCPAQDLANAAEACAGGLDSKACTSFFTVEAGQNSACASCLRALVLPPSGSLDSCLAPYVSPTCNHEMACENDCVQQTCGSCPDTQSYFGCTALVLGGPDPAGACFAYGMAPGDCVGAALANGSPGSFCSLGNYTSVGTWLQGEAEHYCGASASDAGAGTD
jgi:hypothetical protein